MTKYTSNIKDMSSLRDFYYSDLRELCYSNNSKDLNKITKSELIRLLSIITGIDVRSSKTKADILYSIRYYFEDEERTEDLNSKLHRH